MTERRTWAAIPGLLFLAIGAVVLSAYSGASSSKNSSPDQPIPFPHPVHVQTLGLNCLYCHYTANKSPDPGMPAVSTCMGCHSTVGPNRPAVGDQPARTSEGIQKLWDYAGATLSTAALPLDPTKAKPIPWVRIHKLPEYVRFPHMRHVSAGVTCQSCHGQVQGMQKVYQYASLNMGWCVSCHLNGYSEQEGLAAAGYEQLPTPPGGVSPAFRVATDVPERKTARYDCANCHY